MTYKIDTLAYQNIDTKSCIGTLATLTGEITITYCPTMIMTNTSTSVSATIKNTGNVSNSSFVILSTVSRSDNGVVVASGTSGNLTLAPGATSAIYKLTFTMPNVNVNIVVTGQVDPLYNY